MKHILFTFLILLLTSQHLSAKSSADFLLKADDSTSFMNYEYHSLAYEAASKNNFEDAFRIYLKIANKGDERAEYNIGMMYMKGLGVQKKKMNAFKWLRRASKHGNKEASLFFKQMNERYAKKQVKKKKTVKKPKQKPKPEPVIEEPKEVVQAKVPEPIVLAPSIKKTEPEVEESSSLIYIIIAFVLLVIALAMVFVKKGGKAKEEKKTKAPQESVKYKSQMYDITYAHIEEYHKALLKQIDLDPFENDKKKMQAYYMFISGMIDYFSQQESFSETEQRRIFNTHMGKIEGKENITAITQSILEGQKDHSMYHCQAAGGISAKEWHEKKSKESLSMLNKILHEEH